MKRSCIGLSLPLFAVFLGGLALGQSSTTKYTVFTHLNRDRTDVGNVYTKLVTTATAHTFIKTQPGTKIEVLVNTRMGSGTFNRTNGLRFQVRIDDNEPVVYQPGAITTTDTTDFLSFLSVYENLPAGPHTVSIWAQAAPDGSSTGVVVDPGGWGGSIIVKEL
jgi:hypothetical protein